MMTCSSSGMASARIQKRWPCATACSNALSPRTHTIHTCDLNRGTAAEKHYTCEHRHRGPRRRWQPLRLTMRRCPGRWAVCGRGGASLPRRRSYS
jgi:hypothetical protein